ncbi:hypothetical protein EC988_005100, partial [Linderina pennispora]
PVSPEHSHRRLSTGLRRVTSTTGKSIKRLFRSGSFRRKHPSEDPQDADIASPHTASTGDRVHIQQYHSERRPSSSHSNRSVRSIFTAARKLFHRHGTDDFAEPVFYDPITGEESPMMDACVDILEQACASVPKACHAAEPRQLPEDSMAQIPQDRERHKVSDSVWLPTIRAVEAGSPSVTYPHPAQRPADTV